MISAACLFRNAVVAAMAAVLSTAAAAATFELTGDVHETGRTGFPGSTFVLGDPNSSEFALYGLLGKERSDEPCWVQLNNESINASFAKGSAPKDLCGPRGPRNDSLLSNNFTDTGFGGEKAFVSGVSVCMNAQQDKVKGWTLFGRKIEPDGKVVDLTLHTSATRPHCDEWMSEAHCNPGELATAATVHYAPGQEPKSWIGIVLHCRAVRVRS
jgi:hypothetical protein